MNESVPAAYLAGGGVRADPEDAHPGHKTAQEQMRAFGGTVSFRLLEGEEAAVRACGRTGCSPWASRWAASSR